MSYFTGGVLLLIAPWSYWVSTNRGSSTQALFRYYGAYDFSTGGSRGVGDWLASHGPIVAGNAHYLLSTFDLLYLLPLLPGLAPFVAAFTALGVMVSLRREDAFT